MVSVESALIAGHTSWCVGVRLVAVMENTEAGRLIVKPEKCNTRI